MFGLGVHSSGVFLHLFIIGACSLPGVGFLLVCDLLEPGELEELRVDHWSYGYVLATTANVAFRSNIPLTHEIRLNDAFFSSYIVISEVLR
jgi:hypothetical protein